MNNAICFSNWRNGVFDWDATVQNIKDMAKLDPRLWMILRWSAKLFWKKGHPLCVTAAKKKGGSGVHDTTPLRAVDARAIGLSDDMCYKLAQLINDEFPRTDGKSTCLYHDSGEGRHFHFQVSWDFPSSSAYSHPDKAGALY